MSQIDTVRPISVRKAGAGTAVPSGTLAAVTSDNSDATYINFAVADTGNNWSLRVASHTPPTNYQRHRARARIRIRSDAGTMYEDIDLGRGTEDYLVFDTVQATNVFTDLPGSWHFDYPLGLDTEGALADLNIGGGWIGGAAGGGTATRTAECYVDIDCRARPAYTPEVRDAAGVNRSGGTITDTNQPLMHFGGVGYDGLPPLDWAIVLNDEVVSSGTGTPLVSYLITDGLDDGAYTVVFRVRSTIRGFDPFEHVETINFSVANVVPPPSPPIMTVTPAFGGYQVNWADPGGQPWDDNYVVAEVYRTDCTGTYRIATVPDGINGGYLDLAIPQLDPLTHLVDGTCVRHADPCDITYSVRYWGYVSTFIVLPDTIPAQMILGWPGTAGSIPSGWTRVTALDGYYPVGATTTGAPSATGGATSHSHTTPGHLHRLLEHNHAVGGSTGTSNASTTSARFNGASQPQANQPHSHTRPAFTGIQADMNSTSTAPGTSLADNLPPTREVIWISSDGAQANYPIGVLGWATEVVSGWEPDTASAARFLRGAAAAGNGGASNGAALHLHAVNAHLHGGVTHDHSIGSTGLSNPVSSQEAGFGSTPPRWLPRHNHPMDVTAATSANLGSSSGGNSSQVDLEPPNKRLSVLRNVAGGTQTRIIGLYTGTVAGLDPLLTICNGISNGTPDMRTWFARDAGSNSINSVGGTSAHSHTTGSHTHSVPTHTHSTNVLTSTTGSFEAPSSGDLGSSPTTSHDHSSAATGATAPGLNPSPSGTTNSQAHLPPFKEVHFVRLDGTISGGPLPVPELRTSDFSTVTVHAFTYDDGLDRLATMTGKLAVVTDRNHDFPRLVADSTPLEGGLHSVSTTLAGEDMTLVMGVEGLPAINALEALLREERVYYSPLGGTPGWYAPSGWTVKAPAPTVKVLTVTMVRQSWPPTPDPQEFL